MAPPIGIRYYTLRNSGIAIIIYPQFRKSSKNAGDVLWDGRDHSGYNIGISTFQHHRFCQWTFELTVHVDQDWTMDLMRTDISPTKKEGFYLSENTYWGTDKWDTSQEFFYDPNSTLVASATRWGGAHDGSLSYQGIKSMDLNARMANSHYFARSEEPLAEQFESYAASLGHETIRQLFDAAFAAEIAAGFPWKGLVKWSSQLPPSHVVAAVTLVTGVLVARGYALSFTTTTNPDGTKTTTIDFGPRPLPGAPDGVPPEIEADWHAAVARAKAYDPIDLGVSANTQKLSDVDDVPNGHDGVGSEVQTA